MSLITAVIHRYHPEWVPPPNKSLWCRCSCPFHGDETPSAAVNYRVNAYNCMACGVKGDAVALIKKQEGVTHREAVTIAQTLLEGGDGEVPPVVRRQQGRRVFGESTSDRTGDSGRTGRQSILPTRVRRRPFTGA
ncbi:CHC2 zinc finger domain-containing protein [Mycobacteroides abscessus]